MTIKERNRMDFNWTALAQLNAAMGSPATAGEFAGVLGISRNTAKKYLEELTANGAACRHEGIGKNGLKIYGYDAIIKHPG